MQKAGKFLSAFFLLLSKTKPIIIFFIVTTWFLGNNYQKYIPWNTTLAPFDSDQDQYYSYLPAKLIHKDISFTYTTRYWTTPAPNGKLVQRFTCGVALLEAPYFVIGHYIAKLKGYPLDGYSAPYVWSNFVGIILYVLVGLLYVYRSLRFYFNEWISTLVLTILFFTTNLFFYTLTQAQMSHSFLFFLQAVFIFHMLRWHKNGKLTDLLIFSLFGGLAVLVRPSEILIFLMPALLGIYNKVSLIERFSFFFSKKWQLVFGLVAFAVAICPQLMYWKTVTGHFIYYSYGEEGFFFSDPKIIKFLFGYRRGLIPYSPMMIFSLIGFIFLWLKNREIFWAIFIFNAANIYLLSCWWDYGYGGGLGNRAMVQSFTSLAFPMAAFFTWLFSVLKNKWLKIIPLAIITVLFLLCMNLNLLMCRQYMSTVIHWCGMNKETYWFVFEREHFTEKDFAKREQLIRIPDYKKMIKGERDQ